MRGLLGRGEQTSSSLDERIDLLSAQKDRGTVAAHGRSSYLRSRSPRLLGSQGGASAILLQARELESGSRWFLWRREPIAPCARPLEREIDRSSANGFRAMTNAAIDGEHLPGQDLHCLFITFNK